MKRSLRLTSFLLAASAFSSAANPEAPAFESLRSEYTEKILPLLETHCFDCHDTATTKGELDLERFENLTTVRSDPKTWQHVAEQLENGEMPPKKKGKKNRVLPTDAERATLIAWTERYLDTEARAWAGDPGPVILRRLSNAEYTYSIRDLTAIDSLNPLREFPVDSASGEGFTNAGGALVMSPALFEKYLETAKELAAHAVLLPDGFRFSGKTTRTDQANEILADLRAFYLRITGGTGINFAYSGDVRPAAPEGEGEGRLNLTPYFAALIAHRDALRTDLDRAPALAVEAGINSRYFHTLAAMLNAPDSGSLLLDQLRARYRSATPGDAAALAAEVRRWQDRLWSFQKIGTFGILRPWQVPESNVTTEHEIRIKIPPGTTALTLSTRALGEGGAKVLWRHPRFVRTGRPPLLLRDLKRSSEILQTLQTVALPATARYLATITQVRKQGEQADLPALAKAHRLDPELLEAWARYLGLAHDGRSEITGYLTERIPKAGGREFLQGWQLPGVTDYSLLGNSSDQDVKIPGTARAHKIVVHPRPERWIAAGWRSPIDGRATIVASVRDAHNACGNGVSWALERRRGSRRDVLLEGNLDLGRVAVIKPIEGIEVRRGDLFSIVIGARDGSHVCDLTEIDLSIEELAGNKRRWSLSGDCADSMHLGNPHRDQQGSFAVWHFYGGLNEERAPKSTLPPGSLLDQWLAARDDAKAATLAEEIEKLVTAPLPAATSPEDRELHRQLTSLTGPLFGRIEFADLAPREGEPDPAPIDAAGSIQSEAPGSLQFDLPESLVAGSEFVVRGRIHESAPVGTAAQFVVTTNKAEVSFTAWAGSPVVIRDLGEARVRIERTFSDFRKLFPAAMCYARVVPADEVVTLQLYHRDDGFLERLMLNAEEKARLDRLWNELRFVSDEPRRLVTAYEQIWQFSTQDSDPKKIEPLEATVRVRAANFEKRLLASEPLHLDALLTFAPKVYRRPLTDQEGTDLRIFYRKLRDKDLTHEKAFRLTLARLFTAPAFLYKAEAPATGANQGPITDWELATRLSYFLTSSAPDPKLREAAANGQLATPDTLRRHTDRLLHDGSARRLAIHFACQWLHIRDFDQFDEKNARLFPEFAELRQSMSEEAIRFFTDFFQGDRSILSLLDADHTFVDPVLAKFYGLPASGESWQRVDGIRKSGRGGLLGFASTLARQSGASRTSPILRGNWVSETLLGEKLPKPPLGVPQLPETVPEGLSERELIAKHSSDPACAKCHARIDPYGFALEAYDAIGRRREATDTSATLPDGTLIDGIDGLRDYLLRDRRETFVRHFCQKLLGYALGRAVQLSDQPFLDDLMAKLEKNDYRVGTAIEAIVLSPQFREIRGARQPR